MVDFYNRVSVLYFYYLLYKQVLKCEKYVQFFGKQQGCSQEFSFTEARLKGKGTSNAGGLGGTAPQKLTQYIKVTFSILLNSYDNTMA